MKRSSFTCSGVRQLLFAVTISPAVGKTLSDAILVPGTHRYLFAMRAKRGKSVSFSLHQARGLSCRSPWPVPFDLVCCLFCLRFWCFSLLSWTVGFPKERLQGTGFLWCRGLGFHLWLHYSFISDVSIILLCERKERGMCIVVVRRDVFLFLMQCTKALMWQFTVHF